MSAPAPDPGGLYDCEGCEVALERDPATLGWSVRVAGDDEPGERPPVRGRVVQADGVTPAAGVVLHAHHTNAAGLYAGGTSDSVAHIHLIVAEPGRTPYGIDDIVFDGERGVDDAYRANAQDRGGSGIVVLARQPDGTLVAERPIVLERHPPR